MRHARIVATTVGIVMLLCRIAPCLESSEPGAEEVVLSASQTQLLVDEHTRLLGIASDFVEAVEQAKRDDPRLALIESGLKRIEQREKHSPFQKYTRYRADSRSPEAVNKVFNQCRYAFQSKVMSQALSDPNQARDFRPASLLGFRTLAATPGLKKEFCSGLPIIGMEVFDPNDPNDERLWQNVKLYWQKLSEYHEATRKRLLEEEGVPQWLAEYAGEYQFTQGMFTWSSGAIRVYAPKYVAEAKKQFTSQMRAMDKIYPKWRKVQDLLLEDASDDEKAVMDMAYEYDRIWSK